MAIKQTAGRDALGEFAPKFAELNDDVLFGQVWSREDKLSPGCYLQTRTAFLSIGMVHRASLCILHCQQNIQILRIPRGKTN